MRRVDYTGRRFGRLTVRNRADVKHGERTVVILTCQCDCGSIKEYRYGNLVNKITQSCGCLQKQGVRARSKLPEGVAAQNAIYGYYKRNATTRKLDWNISRSDFIALITQPCHYCGTEPDAIWLTPDGSKTLRSGVDRVDSSKGYHVNNCVPCCTICNRAKGALPVPTFLEWLIKLKVRVDRVESEVQDG